MNFEDDDDDLFAPQIDEWVACSEGMIRLTDIQLVTFATAYINDKWIREATVHFVGKEHPVMVGGKLANALYDYLPSTTEA